MTDIVYSQSPHPAMREKGAKYQNPRMFSGVVDGVSRAVVVGDFPDIVKAYKAAGVEVVEPEKEAQAVQTAAVIAESPALTEDQRRSLAIPENWRDLSWTQRDGGGDGLTLRSLASALSDEPVNNNQTAIEVIEGELAKRG